MARCSSSRTGFLVTALLLTLLAALSGGAGAAAVQLPSPPGATNQETPYTCDGSVPAFWCSTGSASACARRQCKPGVEVCGEFACGSPDAACEARCIADPFYRPTTCVAGDAEATFCNPRVDGAPECDAACEDEGTFCAFVTCGNSTTCKPACVRDPWCVAERVEGVRVVHGVGGGG